VKKENDLAEAREKLDKSLTELHEYTKQKQESQKTSTNHNDCNNNNNNNNNNLLWDMSPKILFDILPNFGNNQNSDEKKIIVDMGNQFRSEAVIKKNSEEHIRLDESIQRMKNDGVSNENIIKYLALTQEEIVKYLN